MHPVIENIVKYSDRNAFCIKEEFFTYEQFGRCIAKIQQELKTIAQGEDLIGLVANDDLETYASIFALWLEGKAHVPLQPEYPIERNLDIIDQIGITSILNSSDDHGFSNKKVINTSRLKESIERAVIDTTIRKDATAYVLFTSGSTGKPKGVEVTRQNIAKFIEVFFESGIEITKEDRCSQCFNFSSDVSLQTILMVLTRGACLYTVPADQIKFSYLYGLMEEHNLTIAITTPSMIRFLKPYFAEINCTSMRYYFLVGEGSPLTLINEWKKSIPNATFYNWYGPTETTVYSNYYKLPLDGNDKEKNGLVSLGKPVKDLNVVLVDDLNQIISGVNKKGELCVAGEQVAKGYWNNVEKNKTSYFEALVDNEHLRFYKTGDYCFRDDEGDYFLLSRIDNQVKVQGFRIELSEIEYHVNAFLSDSVGVVIPYVSSNDEQLLALFIEGEPFETERLIASLRDKLPYYMIPGEIRFEKVFPLNPTSKIDRTKLKQTLDHV